MENYLALALDAIEFDRYGHVKTAKIATAIATAAERARTKAIEEAARVVGCGNWMCSEKCEGPKRIRALAAKARHESSQIIEV